MRETANDLTRRYGPPLIITRDVPPGESTISIESPRFVKAYAWSWLVDGRAMLQVSSIAVGDLQCLAPAECGRGVDCAVWEPGKHDLGYDLELSLFGDKAGPLTIKVWNPHTENVKVLIRMWHLKSKAPGEQLTPREIAQLGENLAAVVAQHPQGAETLAALAAEQGPDYGIAEAVAAKKPGDLPN